MGAKRAILGSIVKIIAVIMDCFTIILVIVLIIILVLVVIYTVTLVLLVKEKGIATPMESVYAILVIR